LVVFCPFFGHFLTTFWPPKQGVKKTVWAAHFRFFRPVWTPFLGGSWGALPGGPPGGYPRGPPEGVLRRPFRLAPPSRSRPDPYQKRPRIFVENSRYFLEGSKFFSSFWSFFREKLVKNCSESIFGRIFGQFYPPNRSKLPWKRKKTRFFAVFQSV
jgi:hypothetical protein